RTATERSTCEPVVASTVKVAERATDAAVTGSSPTCVTVCRNAVSLALTSHGGAHPGNDERNHQDGRRRRCRRASRESQPAFARGRHAASDPDRRRGGPVDGGGADARRVRPPAHHGEHPSSGVRRTQIDDDRLARSPLARELAVTSELAGDHGATSHFAGKPPWRLSAPLAVTPCFAQGDLLRR